MSERSEILRECEDYYNQHYIISVSLCAVTVIVCPLNKVEDIAKSYVSGCVVVKEDELNKHFGALCTNLPNKERKVEEGGGGGLKMDWTTLRMCDCPKCELPKKGV